MDKLTRDILPEDSNFFIEKFTYPPYVTMNNSHYHNHYEILYMVRGERKLVINNVTDFILNENTIAIIPPNCIHKTKSYSKDEQTRICIAISENLVEQIKQFTSNKILYCSSFYAIELDFPTKRMVRDLISNLLIQEKGEFLESGQRIILSHLFFVLSSYTYKNNKFKSMPIIYNTPMRTKLDEIIKYIQEHAFEDISLDHIAESFHIQKTYLSRCFKKHTGSTVVTYINNIRMIKAQQLLNEKNISIETVAYTTGYNNRIYFNKVFKKATGLSPKQYQQHTQETQKQ